MTATTDHTVPVAVQPPRSMLVLLGCLGAGGLTQATFAGLFLSGTAQARLWHTILGALLPWFALAVAIVAAVHHVRGTCPPRLATAVYPLPVLFWVQEVLGHVPAPATTVVHVPLGVTLTAYPIVLAGLAFAMRARVHGTRQHRTT